MRHTRSWFRRSPHLAVLGVASAALAAALVIPVFATGTSEVGPLHVTVTATPNAYAIEGQTTVAGSKGVLGYASGTGGIGVEGYAAATSGQSYGLYGHAVSGNGVFAVSDSNVYAAIFGTNTATSGTAIYGSAKGMGVYGTSSAGNGVVGLTSSPPTVSSSFSGVFGEDTSPVSNTPDVQNYGVYGSSTNYIGVLGKGRVAGLFGETSTGTAVYGDATGTAGTAVYGETAGAVNNSYGVYGYDGASQEMRTAGVFGYSNYGAGVVGLGGVDPGLLGIATMGDGVSGSSDTGSGVAGTGGGASSEGTGVSATSENAKSTALLVDATGGTPITVVAGQTPSKIMTLDASGNLTIAGTLTQSGAAAASVARDARGTGRVMYGSQQTESTIEDAGEAKMMAGRSYVALDPAFAGLLDRNAPYLVFITPDGPSPTPLYVSDKSAAGFWVRESSNRATMTFDYRIVGRPPNAGARQRLAFYRDRGLTPAESGAIARAGASRHTALAEYLRSLKSGPRRLSPPEPRAVTMSVVPRQVPIPMERR